MKSKVPVDDPQVKEAMKDIEYSYKRIAELQDLMISDELVMQYEAKKLIEFFETRIAVIQNGLQKAGVMKFVQKLKVEKLG